ncbi:homoserine kinase [bacterium]|nr:homoserine kinase [bacterium]
MSYMKVSVKVPATTANIGPGFDCLGMALPIYNTITIEETVLPGTGIEINVIAESAAIDELSLEHIPLDENSLVYKAVELLYNSIGQTPSELKINIHSNIPVARGLGSSASVIVGALIAANELLGKPADEVALLSIACEIEGHPDNITPAIVGGLVLSSQEDDGSVIYRKLNWPTEWAITVCVPDFELSTDIARSVLPKEVPMKDAIFNAQRLGMFVQAVNTKDAELMKLALKDRLHQPYRMKLVPGLDKIMDNLRHIDSVLGCVLSGAGSSILVISEKNDLDKIRGIVKDTWTDQNIKSDIKTLNIEQTGAQIVSNED